MKYLFVLILVSIPFISSCKKEHYTDSFSQVREAAWNSLSAEDKSTVIIDWEKAPVTEVTYQGKITWAVRFNTSDDALLGPIIIYVDKSTLIVLGQGLRM